MLESPLLRSQEKEVRTLVTTDRMRALRDGRIDAAFVSSPEPDDDLEVHVLEREPLVAVLSDGHHLASRSRSAHTTSKLRSSGRAVKRRSRFVSRSA